MLCTTYSDHKRIFCTLVIDLQYSRKTLFPHILASFSKLNSFKIDSLQKKWFSSLSLLLKLLFLEIPLFPRFRFGSIAQKEYAESRESFRFLISSGDFYQTSISDTILILEILNEYHLDVFLAKQHSFQDSCINHFQCLRKFLFPHILAIISKLNDFTINFSVIFGVTMTY